MPESVARPDELRRVALVVPVRGFDDAKSRLSNVLSPIQRRTLAQNCATGVLRRETKCLKFVVCDDDEVEAWAQTCGAIPIRVGSRGLNASLHEATPLIVDRHPVDTLMIVHADLPLSNELDRVISTLQAPRDLGEGENHVVMVPDRHRGGTNVLALPHDLIGKWEFAYGADSFIRHQSEALRLHCQVEILESMFLGLDIDTADDLRHPLVSDVLPILLPDWKPL